MTIFKRASNYIVELNGVETTLLLVTSVAIYKAKKFPRGLKWKVEEDALFLNSLLKTAQLNPTQQTLEALVFYENTYKEMQGTVPEGATPEQATAIASAKTASESCLLSKDFKKEGVLDGESDSNERLLDQPTIGDLVSARRKQNGEKRLAWRNKPK